MTIFYKSLQLVSNRKEWQLTLKSYDRQGYNKSLFLGRTWRIFLVGLLICYFSGYAAVRSEKLLIHRVTYRTLSRERATKKYSHSIDVGDFGIPLLTGLRIWKMAGICWYIYAPLREGERLFWYCIPRTYAFHRNTPQRVLSRKT